MPQMGESIAEGTIVRWIKKVGDTVDRDEPLFEISTDKVDAEIPSPAAGVLTEIRVNEGETVPVNCVVATIATAGEVPPPTHVAPPSRAERPHGRRLTPQRRRRTRGARSRSAHADAGRWPASRAAAPQRTHGAAAPSADDLRRQKSSPLVRRIAREHNVDISADSTAPASAAASPSTTSSGIIEHGPARRRDRRGCRRAAADARRRSPSQPRADPEPRRSRRDSAALGDAQEDRRAHGAEPAHVGARALGLPCRTSRPSRRSGSRRRREYERSARS